MCSGGVQTECGYHMLLLNSCNVNEQDVYQHLAHMFVQHENFMQELWQRIHFLVTSTLYIF